MKKILVALLALALLILLWYLFVRPYEFGVQFTARTLPGDLIQTIRIWDRSMKNADVLDVDSLWSVTQKIETDGREYLYKWKFSAIDDSTTKVKVQVSEPGRSLANRIMIPFSDQPIERDAEQTARQFLSILNEHLKITRVTVTGETEIPSSFCVCKNITTRQIEKANGMMRDFGLLTSFIDQTKLQVSGPPIIQVLEWKHSDDRLNYDFCFPIVKTQPLPLYDSIHYKVIKGAKVLRAVYNGNYITSDRAWYSLLQFARTNNYQINGLPIERFHNNPNLGWGEERWVAEVFIPIK